MTDNSTVSMIALGEGKNVDKADLSGIIEDIENKYASQIELFIVSANEEDKNNEDSDDEGHKKNKNNKGKK